MLAKIRLVGLPVILGFGLCTTAIGEEAFSPYVNHRGDIAFPAGFRTSMVHLGSWFVPTGEASGFHDVYAEEDAVLAYRKIGRFPDGATLVKELRVADAGDYTTGKDVIYATNEVKQWFVMIKDSKGRFPDNPLWGEGWGWALFQPAAPAKNVAVDYKTDCLGCHVPARDQDWVYTEAYPTLNAP